MVTLSKASACTVSPRFNCSATELGSKGAAMSQTLRKRVESSKGGMAAVGQQQKGTVAGNTLQARQGARTVRCGNGIPVQIKVGLLSTHTLRPAQGPKGQEAKRESSPEHLHQQGVLKIGVQLSWDPDEAEANGEGAQRKILEGGQMSYWGRIW